jgi:glutamine amidotransferase
MTALKKGGWDAPIKNAWQTKPFLGICVGMQMLLAASEENDGAEGLCLLPGIARHMGQAVGGSPQAGNSSTVEGDLKVPHMGWNQVAQVARHPIWQDIPNDARFYFVHSYALPYEPGEQSAEVVAGTVNYGDQWAAALIQDKVVAVQFHPEKSQTVGLTLLRNFMAWTPE